jgi:hypothetical protein
MAMESESEYFSPYRPDGKLYGFVCVVTSANQPVGKAIATELAGTLPVGPESPTLVSTNI